MVTPVLWPPYAESWLIGKDSEAGRDWGQEEKGTTEDEMAGWHHRHDGHEFGWTPGAGDGQRGLACWNSWDHKEWDTTEWLNWTELNWWLTNAAENLCKMRQNRGNLKEMDILTLASECCWLTTFNCQPFLDNWGNHTFFLSKPKINDWLFGLYFWPFPQLEINHRVISFSKFLVVHPA